MLLRVALGILPDLVLGSRGTMTALLNAATGPISFLTLATTLSIKSLSRVFESIHQEQLLK